MRAAMRRLVFEGVPPAVEKKKENEKGPKPRLFGASVLEDTIVRGFLTHGSFDAYHFYNSSLSLGPSPELNGSSGRFTVLNPSSVRTLSEDDEVVLFTARPLPHTMVPLRVICGGQNWPIVAVTHALSDLLAPSLAPGLLMSDLQCGDRVVCSTHAARVVLERLVNQSSDALGLPRRSDLNSLISVVPHGVECRNFQGDREEERHSLGIPAEAVVLLCIGRLTPFAKADLAPLLLTFRELAQNSPLPLRLLIAGDDTRHQMRLHLEEYAHSLGCGEQVIVRSDISGAVKKQLYNAADIFVAPSDHIQEAFGIALVEAMASGLPVVASDWNGFRNVIQHGATGFLVPTYWPDFAGLLELNSSLLTLENRNSVLSSATVIDQPQMSHYLRLLIDNRELRLEMGKKAQQTAQSEFDWSVIVRRYEQMFEESFKMARSQTRPVSRVDPFSYSVQEIFSHYPSRALADDDIVVVSPRGRCWLANPFPLSSLPEGTRNNNDKVAKLLGDLQDKPRRLGEVMELSRLLQPEPSSIWIVGRLLKYGLLELQVNLSTPE